MRAALIRLVLSRTRRLSRQRSTSAPAIGPTTKTGTADAASKALVTYGAQERLSARSLTIQTIRVVSKSESPKPEIAVAPQRRA